MRGFEEVLADVREKVKVTAEDGDLQLALADEAADRARTQIAAARKRAQGQLSETVAALENLRIDLLRLRAGNINLEGVTANLGSARDLTEQVDRLLEGYAEAEALLR